MTTLVKQNASQNQVLLEDRPIHDWYRFVLSFPPHLVRDYLADFGITKKHTVLDPFCGTGTTLVECKKLGIKSVGIEANPTVRYLANAKLDWQRSANGLVRHASKVASVAKQRLEEQGVPDNQDLPLFGAKKDGHRGTELLDLPEIQKKLLIRDSISPIPLHKSIVLAQEIEKGNRSVYYDLERIAFAKTIVKDASNLHFGPEVGVSRRKKSDLSLVGAWFERILKIAEDLELVSDCAGIPAVVHNGDARDIDGLLQRRSINAVITSPPYPNEKDYTRTTGLESVLLGFVSSREELREMKKTFVRSNTRGVYKFDDDDSFVIANRRIQSIANRIERKRIELGKTSGFERLYGRLTKLYFGGMARHLSNLSKVLSSGAQLAYVVGDQASYLRVPIRTGQILAEIAESLGYHVKRIDLFRTRFSTATGETLREEVVVFEWPG